MKSTQPLKDSYFASATSYWSQVYSQDDLVGKIYQSRKEVTLNWVRQLELPPSARIADVGCGVGGTAVQLAQLGYTVTAVDRVPAMLARVHGNAECAGVTSRLETRLCDASNLNLPDMSFDVTLALGLLPWVNHPHQALAEMIRITKAGGHLIISSDNAWRLNYLLDPIDNPLIAPLRRRIGKTLRWAGLMRRSEGLEARMQSPISFNSFISESGLQIKDSKSIGFGGFTVFRQQLFSESTAVAINNYLQALSDRKFPLLSVTGIHHLVLAIKRNPA